jgi:hypothetical protein
MSGNSHQRRVFNKALALLLEKREPAMPAQDKQARIYFFVGLVFALAALGLPLIGITINVWLGALILAGAFICAVRAFWIWEGSLKLHVYLRILTVCVLGLVYVALIGRQVFKEWKAEHSPMPSPVTHLAASVSFGCKADALPIRLPPDSIAQIVLINHKRNQAKNWGFFQAMGSGTAELVWPTIKEVHSKSRNMGVWMYKCTLINNGPTNLVDIRLNLKIYSGAQHGEDFDIHLVQITPLAAGLRANFYVVNECPVIANVVTPPLAMLQVVGEDNPRQLKLDPSEQILMFGPSSVNWTNEPCS